MVVRDEARHLPRRVRAGRATLMAGRSRRAGRGSRGYRLIKFVELGSFEAARGRSVSAVLSAVFPSHELEDFFGPRNTQLRVPLKWASVSRL